ncbi:MAG: hypothetical protein R2818_11665 [Flavobacteriales bacterium]
MEETRRLYPAVEHSMGLRAALLANALAKGRVLAPEERDYMYRYKHAMALPGARNSGWGREAAPCAGGGMNRRAGYSTLDAVLLRGERMPLHFDSTSGAVGASAPVMGVMLTSLMGYFRRYPDLPLYHGQPHFYKQPEYAAAIDQGLVLARQNGPKMRLLRHLQGPGPPERERTHAVGKACDGRMMKGGGRCGARRSQPIYPYVHLLNNGPTRAMDPQRQNLNSTNQYQHEEYPIDRLALRSRKHHRCYRNCQDSAPTWA